MATSRWVLSVVWLAAVGAWGCGGENTGSAESSETSEESKAGFTFTLEAVDPANPNLMGRACSGVGTYTLGDPPPTPTARGGLVNESSDNVSVYCSVELWGDEFEIDLTASRDWLTPNEVNLQVVTNSVSSTGGPVDVTLTTPITGFLVDSARACMLTPVRELSRGTIYADFYCPLVDPIGGGMPACAARGTVEFRGCLH